MIQLKRTIFHYFEVKIQLLLISLNRKLLSLQAEHCLYANLYVACQSRDGDLENFYMHENHLYPPSISEYGKFQKCLTKSNFLVCLNGLAQSIYDPPNIEMKVIDGAAFVNMNPPTTSNTYGQYCDMQLNTKV